jgi:hypothetical protein
LVAVPLSSHAGGRTRRTVASLESQQLSWQGIQETRPSGSSTLRTRRAVRPILDQGNLWPISYALTKLTDTEEIKIAKLVKKAVS